MSTNRHFGINTYSYTQTTRAVDCVRRLAGEGYGAVELMLYPGHMWPAELDQQGRREIRNAAERGEMPIVAVNMPNLDLNVAGATREMRDYTLGILEAGLRLAGDLGSRSIIIGPGKANPLFAPPREELLGHFRRALDRLAPIARGAGVRLLVENMPFCFIPDAAGIMQALAEHGDDEIGVIYDVANGYFIGEDPGEGLRRLAPRLRLIHLSDTNRSVYRHDAVGLGDVPFADVAPVLREVGYTDLPVLEVISRNPDADLRDSVERLASAGYGGRAEP